MTIMINNSCMEQIQDFVEECLVITNVSSDVVGVKDAYRDYIWWCNDMSVTKENSYPEFIPRMGDHLFAFDHKCVDPDGYAYINGMRKRVYTGIKKV